MGLKLSTIQGNIAASGVECDSLEDVAGLILDSNWSCGLYKGGHRNLTNFTEAHLFALDVDGGCPLEVAKTLFAKYAHIIATTRSHRKEKVLDSGVVLPACDRFRVVLVLERPITTKEENYAVYHELERVYPFIDPACKDASRLFYPSVEIVSKAFEGAKVSVPDVRPALRVLEPVVAPPATFRGRLSSTTLRFLAEGALPGGRHKALVKALLDLKQNLYTQEEAEEKLRHLELMDDHAWRTVADIYENRPVRHAPRAAATPTVEGESLTGHDDRGNIERWVRAWLVKNDVSASYSRTVYMGKDKMMRSSLVRKLVLDRVGEGRAPNKELIEMALDEWIDQTRIGHLEATRAAVKGFDPNGTAELEAWCRAVFGEKHEPIYVEVMRHFIWQVKRKLFGLSVEYHMMPVVYGKQGSGKSTAIQQLLSPLGDLVSFPQGLNCIRDERQFRTFMDNFVVMFDEMAHADKADVNEIKNLISGNTIEYRPMGTNERDKGPNNTVLIGASNKLLNEIIMDDTGARRFFQLDSLPLCDWTAVKAINATLAWKCVDEADDESPARRCWDEINSKQERFRHKNAVEEFMLHCGAAPSDEHWMRLEDILRKFNDWYQGTRWNSVTFGRRLKALGYTSRHTRRGNEWGIVTNEVIKPEIEEGEF